MEAKDEKDEGRKGKEKEGEIMKKKRKGGKCMVGNGRERRKRHKGKETRRGKRRKGNEEKRERGK